MVEAGFARHYSRYSGNCPNKEVIEKSEAIARATTQGFGMTRAQLHPGIRKLKASEQR